MSYSVTWRVKSCQEVAPCLCTFLRMSPSNVMISPCGPGRNSICAISRGRPIHDVSVASKYSFSSRMKLSPGGASAFASSALEDSSKPRLACGLLNPVAILSVLPGPPVVVPLGSSELCPSETSVDTGVECGRTRSPACPDSAAVLASSHFPPCSWSHCSCR